MKKIITITIMIILVSNAFSAQILNNKNNTLFPNKELRSLIFGNYSLDTELAVVSKVSGGKQESITKAENEARSDLQSATRDYSYNILNDYLTGSLITGPGFDSKKMKEFADDISKELINNAEKRGMWTTSKNETVVLYTLNKQLVKNASAKAFSERLDSVVVKLTEYKNVFQQTQLTEY